MTDAWAAESSAIIHTVDPDTSAQAIRERLGHEPATLAEFGVVKKPADGEG
jgi:hypothetical protein